MAIIFLAIGAFALFAATRSKAATRATYCPTQAELNIWAIQNGLFILFVNNRSQMLSAQQIIETIYPPIQSQFGFTEQQFWDSFTYFVATECRFYVYNYRTNSFSPSTEPLEDFLEWKRAGRLPV